MTDTPEETPMHLVLQGEITEARDTPLDMPESPTDIEHLTARVQALETQVAALVRAALWQLR